MKRKQGYFIWRFRKQRRLLAFMLASALLCSMLTVSGNARISRAESEVQNTEQSHELSNPVTDSEGITTWDCVCFGNYWQNDTNGDGIADKNDEKEPIKWRVLSVDGDDAFLLADKNLDVQRYNDSDTDVTWEICTMRSWLNGYGAEANMCGNDYTNDNFLNNAFTDLEQAAIQETNVVNEDNPECGTEGDNDTTDKVYLLSFDEARNPQYGFRRTTGSSDAREAVNTAYVADGGETKSGHMCSAGSQGLWWLRSPGDGSGYASLVNGDGYVHWGDDDVDIDYYAVRPALHLNLSSVSKWSYAGSITSDKGWIRVETPAPDEGTNNILRNPATDSDGNVTWDCVYFGNYWQSDTNRDGVADKSDEKEPVKWRVLSVDGDDAFLLADKNLDVQKYNDILAGVTWETCTMRNWLNGIFMKNVFTDSEQAAIRDTVVINADNREWDTEGGNDTVDKVFLLSVDEAVNPIYGFERTGGDSNTRKAVNTAYVEVGGEIGTEEMSGTGNSDYWWLRSSGDSSCYASYVYGNGDVNQNGSNVYYLDEAVRPALHLNLSSVSEWSYAGTVTVFGDKAEVPVPSPEVTEKPSPSAIPTKAPEQSEESGKPSVTPSLAPEETGKPLPSVVPTKVPVQLEEPGKPSVTPSPIPGIQQAPSSPVHTPGAQSETPRMTAIPAVQKPGKVTGLKLKVKKNGIQASWKKCNGAAGYEVWYGTSKKLTDKKKKNVKSAKITITKLKKKKTYYVKVRAFVNQNGKKVYGAWSSTAKKKVK